VEDKKNIMLKAYLIYFLVGLVMLAIVVRIIAIQYGSVVPESKMASELDEDDMPTKVDSIQPLRGRILSDDGSDLVTSVPLYNLHIDLSIIDDELFREVDSLAFYLAKVFPEHSKLEWNRALRKGRAEGRQYFPLKNRVKYDVLQQVRNFPILRERKYKGGFIEEKISKRQMPYGVLAKRTLGYKREGAMPVGLEGAFDEYLMGEYGLVAKQYVSNGWKPVGGDYLKDPVIGADIVTTIDIDIQDVAENELKRQLETQQALHGSVVLMEVETGFVKAIANLTRGADGEYYESYNHAIGRKTDPGSTFKLASLMALLEDGRGDITDTVNAKGKYEFYDHKVVDTNPWGYGNITIQHAFEVSSNVFSQIINEAYYDDAQTFVDRLNSFGLADKLGIEIAGEADPVIKNRGEDGWSGITLPQMAIGYEVEITPLQTLAFYNAVANNGELVKPQFVRQIRREGEVVKDYEKIVLQKEICSKQTIEKLKKCLEGVVQRGTGKDLKSANFQIAGKTGTAKIAKENLGYSNFYQASFVGYFPADKPKYSCIVVIAGPTQQIYGAAVSGTVFTAIANKVHASSLEYHTNYNGGELQAVSLPKVKTGNAVETERVLKTMGVLFKNSAPNSDYVVAIKTNEGLDIQRRAVEDGKVPNAIGMPLNDAVYMLETAGLNVRIRGVGKVVKQSITAGTALRKGEIILLTLSE
jgi:cell division protein FtsI (penicillin-binding protein 3)